MPSLVPPGVRWVVGIVVGGALSATGCTRVDTDPRTVVAVSLDSVASPSVVAGDTLRDTFGIARPLRGSAYNVQGNVLVGFPLRYRAIDAGLHVDSVTGVVTGDTARALPVRVLTDARGLQTQPVQLFVVPPPNTVVAVQQTDTLAYSLRDSVSISAPLSVRVLHVAGVDTTAVQGYLVSFAIQPRQAPADTLLAQLVDDAGRRSWVDTTAGDGSAGRRIALRPARLHNLTDSVVVYATAKYHGSVVSGGPARLVLQVRPGS